MADILDPLLTEVVTTTPTVSVLTSVDIDLDLERTKAAALIMAIDVGFDQSAQADADDWSYALIARPDYAVQTVGDAVEGWRDPDFIGGEHWRTGGAPAAGYTIVPGSGFMVIPGGGYLTTRRMSALIFSDNASIEWSFRVWYKLVILTSKEIDDFFFLRR